MSAADFLWHAVNSFAVGLMFALVVATGAKLAWRARLRGVAWWRVCLAVAATACAMTVIGALVFGRDGRMATYGLMVLAGAGVLGWLGRAGRR